LSNVIVKVVVATSIECTLFRFANAGVAKVRALRNAKERVLQESELDVNNIVILGHYKEIVAENGSVTTGPFVNRQGYPFDVARVTGIPDDSVLRAHSAKDEKDAQRYVNRDIEVCFLKPTFPKACKSDAPYDRIRNYGHASSFQAVNCSPVKTQNKKQPLRNDVSVSTISLDCVTLALSCLAKQYKLPEIAKLQLTKMDDVLYSTVQRDRVRYAKECCQMLQERLHRQHQELVAAPSQAAPEHERYTLWTNRYNGPIDDEQLLCARMLGFRCAHDLILRRRGEGGHCLVKPEFNFEGQRQGRFCAAHQLQGMVRMKPMIFRDVIEDSTDDDRQDEEGTALLRTDNEIRAIRERLDVRLGRTKV
jgi:hypothetical protein